MFLKPRSMLKVNKTAGNAVKLAIFFFAKIKVTLNANYKALIIIIQDNALNGSEQLSFRSSSGEKNLPQFFQSFLKFKTF